MDKIWEPLSAINKQDTPSKRQEYSLVAATVFAILLLHINGYD